MKRMDLDKILADLKTSGLGQGPDPCFSKRLRVATASSRKSPRIGATPATMAVRPVRLSLQQTMATVFLSVCVGGSAGVLTPYTALTAAWPGIMEPLPGGGGPARYIGRLTIPTR